MDVDENTKEESLERDTEEPQGLGRRRRSDQSSGKKMRIDGPGRALGAKRMVCQQGDSLPMS